MNLLNLYFMASSILNINKSFIFLIPIHFYNLIHIIYHSIGSFIQIH
jgi:hypothetical protein